MIGAIVDDLAPALVVRNSNGKESAAQQRLTAGDNSDLTKEASFAALCGVIPVPASSGKVSRRRLNRGGDRAANSALHIIAIRRRRTDPRSKAYVATRIAEGHSKLEAIRCLKRYIAREVYSFDPTTCSGNRSNPIRYLTNRKASEGCSTCRSANGARSFYDAHNSSNLRDELSVTVAMRQRFRSARDAPRPQPCYYQARSIASPCAF